MAKVVFHCGRYPQLMLTVVPFGLKDQVGNKKPAKHLQFGVDVQFGPGILKVDDEMAKFVREHEYFKAKKIIEVSDPKDIPVKEKKPKVQAGSLDSGNVHNLSGAPADGSAPVKAARVPRK